MGNNLCIPVFQGMVYNLFDKFMYFMLTTESEIRCNHGLRNHECMMEPRRNSRAIFSHALFNIAGHFHDLAERWTSGKKAISTVPPKADGWQVWYQSVSCRK